MANSFYGIKTTDKNKIPYYAVLVSLESHLANLLLLGDTERIITASNAYALRRRCDLNKVDSALNMPFINFKRNAYDFSGTGRWNFHSFTSGVYLKEIGKKIRVNPVAIDYEATFWCPLERDLQHAFHLLRSDADSETKFETIIEIDGYEVPLMTYYEYTSLEYDPTYDESDWLEKNKIHTIAMSFRIHMYDVYIPDTCNVCITEKVLFDFIATHGLDNTTSYEEAMEFLLNHFDESITPV